MRSFENFLRPQISPIQLLKRLPRIGIRQDRLGADAAYLHLPGFAAALDELPVRLRPATFSWLALGVVVRVAAEEPSRRHLCTGGSPMLPKSATWSQGKSGTLRSGLRPRR